MHAEPLTKARPADSAPRPRVMSAGLYGEIQTPMPVKAEPRVIDSAPRRGVEQR